MITNDYLSYIEDVLRFLLPKWPFSDRRKVISFSVKIVDDEFSPIVDVKLVFHHKPEEESIKITAVQKNTQCCLELSDEFLSFVGLFFMILHVNKALETLESSCYALKAFETLEEYYSVAKQHPSNWDFGFTVSSPTGKIQNSILPLVKLFH